VGPGEKPLRWEEMFVSISMDTLVASNIIVQAPPTSCPLASQLMLQQHRAVLTRTVNGTELVVFGGGGACFSFGVHLDPVAARFSFG
jgi:hypothetical protein